jgi:hypothetical protein
MLLWRPDRFNHVVSGSLSARLAVLLLQGPVEQPLLMNTGAVPGSSGFQSEIECRVSVGRIAHLAKECDTIEMSLKYC